ncbi:hypothetical protein J1N35_029674 [Gossypium stocksii]|uniref:RNase H type-1 domain-containing protein n=1 Tax=Gossypium stocksii TaxID=47602 RepID=A0A9D3ZTF2_9ROSI|nr:hypothetical protein J1N35_029674 [Gossypium stocksii]
MDNFTANFIKNYLKELNNLSNKLPKRKEVIERWKMLKNPCVKDSRGQMIGSKIVINENIPLMFAAEALACIHSIQMGLYLGIKAVEVKGDSLTVVKKAEMNEEDRSKISTYIKDAKR